MSSSSLKRFLVMYSSFFVCLMLIFGLFIKEAGDMYMTKTVETAEGLLKKDMARFENILSAYQETALILQNNANVITSGVINEPFSPGDIAKIRNVLRDFGNQVKTLQGCTDTGLILQNGMGIVRNMFFADGESMFVHFHMEGFPTYDEWFAYLSSPDTAVTVFPQTQIISEKTYDGLLYVFKIPIMAKSGNKYFFATMDTSYIQSLFMSSDITANGRLSLYTQDGMLLYGSGESGPVSYTDICASSSKYGITANVGIDNAIFSSQIRKFRNMALIFSAAYLAAGILLSLLYSYRSSMPVRRLLKLARSIDDSVPAGRAGAGAAFRSEYNYIQDILMRNHASIESFRQELSQQKEQLRFGVFCNLIDEKFSLSDISQSWNRFFPDFGECCYIALISCENEPSEDLELISMKHLMITNAAKSILPNNCIMYHINNSLMVLTPGNEEYTAVHDMLISLRQTLLKTESVKFRIVYSDKPCDIGDIRDVYRELKFMLRFSGNVDRVLARSEFISMHTGKGNCIKMADHSTIYKLILDGNTETIYSMIDDHRKDIESLRSADDEYLKCIFYTYISAFREILQVLDRKPGNEIPKYDPKANIALLFERLKLYAVSLMDELNKRSKENENNFEQSVIGFIRENVFDKGMYSKMVTDQFCITEATMQRILKNQTGKTFFTFVEELRMEKAKSLIEETDIQLNKVYEDCGYNSHTAFYKAFKKYFGISPSKIRKKQA